MPTSFLGRLSSLFELNRRVSKPSGKKIRERAKIKAAKASRKRNRR